MAKKRKFIVITKENIKPIYGRILKFFNSCSDGQGFYDFSTDKRRWSGNELMGKYLSDKAEMTFHGDHIHFEYPVRTDISIGDKIYIDSNVIMTLMRYSDKKKFQYSKFYDVYERNIIKRYDTL